MKYLHVLPILIGFACSCDVVLAPHHAYARETRITSREYKLILDASQFVGADPLNAINHFFKNDIQAVVDNSIGRRANGSHRYKGMFELDKERVIRFWDTTAPTACILQRHQYIFRERVGQRNGQEDNDKREVTLKFRHADRYLAAKKDMRGTHPNAETKFEEDIAQVIVRTVTEDGLVQRYTDMKPSFKSTYSHSTTQPIGPTRQLDTLDAPLNLYPGLREGLEDEGAVVPNESNIVPVSDLAIEEKVYRGPVVDLGNLHAHISLTLWYKRADLSHHPLVSEISFKYKLKDRDDEFSEKVVRRASKLFFALQRLETVQATSPTKTAFVYNHRNFCRE